MTPIIADLMDDNKLLEPFMTTTLTINSPGGYVSQLELLIEAVENSPRKIVTKLPRFAASAASSMFLLGKERLMGKKAEILFHEVRIMVGGVFGMGSTVLTYSDLKSILVNGTLAPNSALAHKEVEVIKMVKTDIGAALPAVVASLEQTHEAHIKFLMDKLNMTREVVLKTLLVTNTDIVLNFEQARKLNVATGAL